MKIKALKITKLVLMFLLLVVLPSCQKMPFYAVDGATLVIAADKSQLKTGGDKAIITVIGFNADGEVLHDHTMVTLTASLGSITAAVELMQGRATAEFVSGDRNGTAEITARSGNIVATPEPLTITIGSGSVETLTIQANPTVLKPGGGRSLISVYAFDKSMNPLADIPIILSTTYGVLDHGNNIRLTDGAGKVSDYLSTEKTARVTAEFGTKTAVIEVKVEDNQLPVAEFSISPAKPTVGETVYFNASLSTDPDGRIISWSWNFGDGSTASGQVANHIYDVAGTFTVTLKVIDEDNGSAACQKTITIGE
jgi:PKD repeat protein